MYLHISVFLHCNFRCNLFPFPNNISLNLKSRRSKLKTDIMLETYILSIKFDKNCIEIRE